MVDLLVAVATGFLGSVSIIAGLVLIGHKEIGLPHHLTLGPAQKPLDPESDSWFILLFVWLVSLSAFAIGLAVLL